MADQLVMIAQFPNCIDAEMAKQSLADHDIEAVVTGENVSNTYSGMPPVGRILHTANPRQPVEKAREILESRRDQEK